jgi:hypothetical protein
MKTLLTGLVLLIVIPAMIAQAPSADALDHVRAAVEAVPGIQLDYLEAESDTLLAAYITREYDEIGYRAEILDVYRALGAALADTDLPVARLTLITRITTGDDLEQISSDASRVLALAAAEITRSQFLEALEITPLEHTRPGRRPGGRT